MTDVVTTGHGAVVGRPAHVTPLLDDDPARIRPFDFTRQETIERGRLRMLRPPLENIAVRMSSRLSTRMRQIVHLSVEEDFAQVVWEEFAGTLPDPTVLSVAVVQPIDRRFVLHLPVSLGLLLVDFSLGGDGKATIVRDDLTEIEHDLLAPLFEELWRESIVPALSPVMELSAGPVTSAHSPVLFQIGRTAEMCLVVDMRLEIGESGEHPISLIMPLGAARLIVEALEREQSGDAYSRSSSDGSEVERALHGVPVEVLVAYPSITLTPAELVDLQPGDVIPLLQRGDEDYDALHVVVGETVFATAAVVDDGRRLTVSIISTEEVTL